MKRHGLDAAELQSLKALLLEREKQLVDAIQAERARAAAEPFEQIASEAPDSGDASVADLSVDSASAERERQAEELREVQAALGRMQTGSYGFCEECGAPIPVERLRASPAARFDLQHQNQRERESAVRTPKL